MFIQGPCAKFRRPLQIAAMLTICVATAFATAKTTAIGSCRPDLPSFNTFSDAISGSPDGSTILVCPGTYPEQFTVDRNLTITGIQSGNSGLPVIVPPATGLAGNIVTYNVASGFLGNAFVAAQIIVSPGVKLNISNVSLDTSNLPNCNALPIGIYFADSSGTVNHVAFRNQNANCFNPNNPYGDAIFVQSDGTQPASVNVLNSSFHNPGWMAVHADGAGASVNLTGNTAVGPGPTAGNGILIEWGATAGSITNNSISNALLNSQITGFWGILLNNCGGGSTVNNNSLSNTQYGINVICSNNTITNNLTFNTQLDGIYICGSNNTVKANTINDSGRAGVNLAQGCSEAKNTVFNNTINGACAGTLIGADISLLSNNVSGNSYFNTKYVTQVGTTCN